MDDFRRPDHIYISVSYYLPELVIMVFHGPLLISVSFLNKIQFGGTNLLYVFDGGVIDSLLDF